MAPTTLSTVPTFTLSTTHSSLEEEFINSKTPSLPVTLVFMLESQRSQWLELNVHSDPTNLVGTHFLSADSSTVLLPFYLSVSSFHLCQQVGLLVLTLNNLLCSVGGWLPSSLIVNQLFLPFPLPLGISISIRSGSSAYQASFTLASLVLDWSSSSLGHSNDLCASLPQTSVMAIAMAPATLQIHFSEQNHPNHTRKFRNQNQNTKDILINTTTKSIQRQKGELKDIGSTMNVIDQHSNCVDSNTDVSLLQAFANIKALPEGKKVHAQLIITSGIEQNVLLGTKLVTMYARCGSIEDARLVFDEMPERNLFSWTAMIGGYVKHGHFDKALALYYQMKHVGSKPDTFIFTSILKACANLTDFRQGREIHSDIVRIGYESDVFVGNALVDMYAKCGKIENARQVFDKMYQRDVVTWNVMIAGYGQNGYGEEALKLFSQMQLDGVKPNVVSWNTVIGACTQSENAEEALNYFRQMVLEAAKPSSVTIASVLKACAGLTALREGKEIHSFTIKSSLQENVFVESTLIDMYSKCGRIKDAHHIFDKMSNRNVISWNAMIGGLAQNGHGEDALKLFHQMQLAGLEPDMISWNAIIAGYAQNGHGENAIKLCSQMRLSGWQPDMVTTTSILKASAGLSALRQGKEIHGYIIRKGFESNIFVESALVGMYAKCRSIKDAQQVFERMSTRDAASWTAMIAGYAQNGHIDEAQNLFCQMQLVGLKPGLITWNAMITGYARNGHRDQAWKLFCQMQLAGVKPDLITWNVMIGAYAQTGNGQEALNLFHEMKLAGMKPNVISWTAIIAGYTQNGHGNEAMKLFRQMQMAGIKPDSVTITSILKACAGLAALERGKEIHGYIMRSGSDLGSVFIGSALVDMYAKCGSVEDASQVFHKMSQKNVVSWNAMIAGYAMHGYGKDALTLFDQMQLEGMKPNHITFTGVLSACSYAGLADEGWQCFNCLTRDYQLTPRMGHYACMVDLLGRAGRLDEAQEFIDQMPIEPDACVWGALLGACRILCNIELGVHVAEKLFELEPEDAGNYVLLSNIYAAAGRWDDVAKTRLMMKNRGIQKIPGCSWIEVKNKVHIFHAGDRSHPQTGEIYAMLEKLLGKMRDAGFVPNTNLVL
eukprot:Gb_27830 [translate_table: standard]